MKNKGKLTQTNTVWAIEASRILGISAPTFRNRLYKGIYEVSCVRCPKGFRYSIFDVFKIAHPTLKDREIEKLIMEYRVKCSEMRAKKRGGKK